MSKPPKEVFVHIGTSTGTLYTTELRANTGDLRYILAPEHRAPKREVVAWVIKQGSAYLYAYATRDWTNERCLAVRYSPEDINQAREVASAASARVVALVRKEVKS